MMRTAAALVASCFLAAPALAKDLCVAFDGGIGSGTELLLKDVKGNGAFGPVYGYVNHPDPVGGGARLGPVSGTALTSRDGVVVIGLTWYEVTLYPNGGTNVLNDLFAIHLACDPGSDGKLGEADSCDAFIASSFTTAHVISCKTVAQIP